MRKIYELHEDHSSLKEKLLSLSHHHDPFIFLDSNHHIDPYGSYDWICAFGCREDLISHTNDPFSELYNFHLQQSDWLFGHLLYDLKNKLEDLNSEHKDDFSYPDMYFFVPEWVVYKKGGKVFVEEHSELVFPEEIEREVSFVKAPSLQAKTSREDYLENIKSIKEQLQYGNIYELNYCIEFSAVHPIPPLSTFNRLNNTAQAPFSAFYKNNDLYLLCASPERYMRKTGNKIISQPIKGTMRRSPHYEDDEKLKRALAQSEKERSENVMIVDLVRNDLSRTAAVGSVKIEELYGIHSFKTVHQMISTVSSQLQEKRRFTDALKYSFPMGSMTGAPKISAMKLIEEHENFSRSLFSGSVGYISPQADFDFNVVIRSILYNAQTEKVSVRVGSAITIHCDAEEEYEECLLKAQNLFRALGQQD